MKNLSLLSLSMLVLTSASVSAYRAEYGPFAAEAKMSSFTVPGTNVESPSAEASVQAGPVQYKINLQRALKYALLACNAGVSSTKKSVYSANDEGQEAASTQRGYKVNFSAPSEESLKTVATQMAADVAYDTVEPYVSSAIEGQGEKTEMAIRAALYLALTNAAHNVANGGPYQLYIPFVEVQF